MAQTTILNGVSYSIPDPGDTGWGAGLTAFLVAIAPAVLQKTGGTFTLTSELNFGTSFGVNSLYYKAGNGTAGAPSFTFASDTDTGIYRGNPNEISFAINGTKAWRIQSNNLFSSEAAGAVIQTGAGSASTPGLAFDVDPDTGFYRISADRIGISTGGVLLASLRASAFDVSGASQFLIADGTAALPAIALSNNTDTGIYRRASQSLGFSAAGTLIATLNSTGFSIDTGSLQILAGTVGSPSIQFGADPDTGIYRSGTNSISLAAGATQALEATANGTSILGTNTNNNASVGFVGEYISASLTSNTNFPASNAFGDATSISLTAGDWDVDVEYYFDRNTATWTSVTYGISITAGNDSTGLTRPTTANSNGWVSSATTPQEVAAHLTVRFSLSATTTIYAKVLSVYSAGQPQYRSSLTARRIR